MRALLIDSYNKIIKSVELPDNETSNLAAIYKLIKARCICLGPIINSNGIGYDTFVDDEGLINGTEVGFMFPGSPQVYAGNALVVGTTESGDTASCDLPESALDEIIFLTRTDRGWTR